MAYERVNRLTAYGEWALIQLVKQRMTVTELAEATGIARTSLSKFFYGARPGYRYAEQVEKVLGPPPEKIRKAS